MSEDRDDTYDPSTVEIDRGRQQGLGMGARDLQGQRDPGDGLESEGLHAGEEDEDKTVDELGRASRPQQVKSSKVHNSDKTED